MAAAVFDRILEPPAGSFFLFGPRGTGKSTWLRRRFPGAYRVDLLDEARYQSYLADAGLFGAELRARPPGSLVVVDEVQRLPSLLNEVHRQMEERGLRFALVGSSARRLKQAGTNLLAGRAVRRHMHPFVPEEMGAAFDLSDVLRFGALPVVWGAPSRDEALSAYVQMYLREEIQAEALVRNLPGFARFLPVAALMHGQVVNVAGLARDAEVSRTTVAGYLDILEDTLLGWRLPAYEARLRVRERRHPKLYWADPGLVRAVKKQTGPPAAEEMGALWEGFIAQILRAYRDYRGGFDDLAYWASLETREVEVDFLLRRGDALCAIEAKAARKVAGAAFRGLRAVAALPGLVRRILVYRGATRLRAEDGIDVLPARDFFDAVERDALFEAG